MNRNAACSLLAGVLLVIGSLPAYASETVSYYLTDALHSTTVVEDAQGNVIERTRYAPYGQTLNRPLHDGLGYAGAQTDAATGLIYMQQRYYDPETGTMLSSDPVAADPNTGTSFNRYAYANDNPYRYTDPTGMCTGTHICNDDGTAVSTGDFTTQGRSPYLVGATAAQRSTILSLPVQMHLSQQGTQFISNHEGFSGKKYSDVYGNETIGYGHLVKPGDKPSDTISKSDALKLLARDAETAVRFVNGRTKVPLQQNQFDALTDTAFNGGFNSEVHHG